MIANPTGHPRTNTSQSTQHRPTDTYALSQKHATLIFPEPAGLDDCRLALSFRDIEKVLAARGIVVSYEAVRQWCLKFGQGYANHIRYQQGNLGDTWFLDKVFTPIHGAVIILGVQSIKMAMCWISLYRSIMISMQPDVSLVND